MTEKQFADIAVAGGGIVGICCALALSKAGLKVLLIDRDEPGQGASYGNAGVISPWSLIPQSVPGLWQKIPKWLLKSDGPIAIKPSYLFQLLPWTLRFLWQGRIDRMLEISVAMKALNQNNVGLFKGLLAGTGHENLVQDSYYVHAYRNADHANLDSVEYAIRRDQGAELEKIGQQELQALEPALSKEFNAAILIKGQARALSPGKIGQVLMEKFIRHGGQFIKAEVEKIQHGTDGKWTIKTEQIDLISDRVVLSLGAWSKNLLKPLGIDVPLEAERGYHLEYANPGIELNHSVMDMEVKIVASSMADGLRAAGTAEFAGLDSPPNMKRVKSLNTSIKRMLPELNTVESSHWMGTRPSFPDSLPCIGEVAQLPGLYTAFGHSHFGLMMAPKTGEIISNLILGKSPGLDISPYRLERFTN